MNNIKEIFRKLKKIKNDFISRRKILLALRQNNDPFFSLILNSFKSVINCDFTPEEREWINNVETLRNELINTTKQIKTIDFGAGTPSSELTNKQMKNGRIIITNISEVCKASVPFYMAIILFKLIRETSPTTCLELGTCLGISSSYILAALHLNRHGRLVTIEGSKTFVELAKKNFKKLGLQRVESKAGRFQEVLKEVLPRKKPLDFVFIDGHHDEQATLNYFETILPFCSKNTILVLDDINWSNGMVRSWKKIANNDTINYSINFNRFGICVLSETSREKSSLNLVIN